MKKTRAQENWEEIMDMAFLLFLFFTVGQFFCFGIIRAIQAAAGGNYRDVLFGGIWFSLCAFVGFGIRATLDDDGSEKSINVKSINENNDTEEKREEVS